MNRFFWFPSALILIATATFCTTESASAQQANASVNVSSSPATWSVRLGGGYAIAGDGDQTSPHPHVEVTAPLVGPLHLTSRLSVFHDNAWSESLAFGSARLTLTSLDLGLRVYPISSKRHHLGFTLAPSLRTRSSERVIATRGSVDAPEFEALVVTSQGTDVGYAMGMEYGVRLFGPTALVAEMRGASYREGTSVFLFGLGLQLSL